MKLIIISNKTALYLAVEKGNLEMVTLLLSNDKVNINSLTISKQILLY